MSEKIYSLYRKYRPKNFSEVKGQTDIVTILSKYIETKQLPHAMLFTGTRGTGKTTLARIFSKEIGTKNLDLHEIDAASNRGIDDIRELREAVNVMPYESEYKVYIIDEVHMLTKEAFNALLKTLEEPPNHVIFILATTEEDKLPETILSRCQIFRMKPPTVKELSDLIMTVSEHEKKKITKTIADLVAVSANGSFRDALGLAQKVLILNDDERNNIEVVSKIIGLPSLLRVNDFLYELHRDSYSEALKILRETSSSGINMRDFFRLLLNQVRAVMLIRNNVLSKDEVVTDFSTEIADKLILIAKDKSIINSHFLLRLLQVSGLINQSPLPHLPLELVIMELSENSGKK